MFPFLQYSSSSKCWNKTTPDNKHPTLHMFVITKCYWLQIARPDSKTLNIGIAQSCSTMLAQHYLKDNRDKLY